VSSELLLELLEACDRIGVRSLTVRAEMSSDPARALRVIAHAARARGIRNRAAFAVARWQASTDAGSAVIGAAVEPVEPVGGAPSLADLERAWALEPSPAASALLDLMALAIERHGGFSGLE
jgi:hypothetical protein